MERWHYIFRHQSAIQNTAIISCFKCPFNKQRWEATSRTRKGDKQKTFWGYESNKVVICMWERKNYLESLLSKYVMQIKTGHLTCDLWITVLYGIYKYENVITAKITTTTSWPVGQKNAPLINLTVLTQVTVNIPHKTVGQIVTFHFNYT